VVAIVLQVLISGLAAGAGYGLVAISFSVIYRLTGVVHFALGELIGLSVFVTLYLATGTRPVTTTNVSGGRYALAILGGLAVAIVGGLVAYFLAVRPFLRRGNLLGWIGALVALGFAVRGFLAATFERSAYVFSEPIPFHSLGDGGVLSLGGGVSVPYRAFFVIAVGVALAAAASRLLARTGLGIALQGLAQEPLGARVVGLPVDRLLAGTFAAAGGLAAIAAIVQAPGAPVTVDTGSLLALKGLAAALLARFGSPWRALAAGLGIGVLEYAVSSLHIGSLRLGAEYRDWLPLAVVLAAMGLLRLRRGEAELE
jgi:branched-chain amino acid transport system permease protein